MVGKTRAHFLGLLRQVLRAVPKVPGYRCNTESRHIDEVGYGRNARRAAPERMYEEIWCFGRGTDPRKRYPDVTITVLLSMLPANIAEGEPREKQPDLMVFSDAKGVGFLYGKVREWRDAKGVVHRGYDRSPAISRPMSPEEEVIQNGPYLVYANVSFAAVSTEARDAFVGRFDRAAVAALMAREAERRKADPQAGPIVGVLR